MRRWIIVVFVVLASIEVTGWATFGPKVLGMTGDRPGGESQGESGDNKRAK